MFDLKPLSKDAIPRALEKAERYRLLNEPVEAESICRDVLGIDPQNQRALVTLLLALTEQFEGIGGEVGGAKALLPLLKDEYERTYYAGIISERQAKARIAHRDPGSSFAAYEAFREAMTFYERAEAIRPPGNDDALLRWNTCARILMAHSDLRPAPVEAYEPPLE
jgi:tetratricopeptide (TPR) repeat protein